MNPGTARALFDSNGYLIFPESFLIHPYATFCLVTINYLDFILVPAEPPHNEYDNKYDIKKDYPNAQPLVLLTVFDSVKLSIPDEFKKHILKIIQLQDMYLEVTHNNLIRFYDRSEGQFKNIVRSQQTQLQ